MLTARRGRPSAAWAVVLLVLSWPAQATVALTAAEQAWLRDAPPVVVSVQSDYAPFSYIDGRGVAAGYSNELFQLAAAKVGLRYRFAPGQHWDVIQEQAQAGRIDVLTCLWRTPERERYLRFVEPAYLSHGLGWAVRADDPQPPDGNRVQGKRIAIARGFAVNPALLQRYPEARFVQVESAADALRLVSLGKADAYVDNIGLINYLSAQQGFANLLVRDTLDLPGTAYYMAVDRRQPMLQAILAKGLAAVTEPERRQLEDRWLHETPSTWQALQPYARRGVAALLLLALVVGWLLRSNRRLASEIERRREFETAAQERATQLEQRAAFERSLLDVAQAAILVLDARGRWVVFNRFAEQLLGYRADEILGRVVRSREESDQPGSAPHLVDPEQTRHSLALLQDTIGRPVADDWRALYLLAELRQPPQQIDLLHKDGHHVPVVLSLAYVADAQGRPTGLIAIANDLSEQKRLEHDLRASQALAQEASHAKSAFLAAMSHEIRTPMIGITGMVEILAHTTLDPGQRDALTIMQSSTRALLDVLGDILDFSKIEANRIELHPAATDLRQLVHGIVSSFGGAASSKGLTLACRIDDRIAPAHRVDPLRLRQILGNCLSNAIKFTEHGGVDVTLDAIDAHATTELLRFSVTDTGIGITPEQQTRLFQPFAQADSDTTRRYGGTGLGLAISRHLAELMGGSLRLESTPASGTTLHLELALPRATPADITAEHPLDDDAGFSSRPVPSVAQAEHERSLVLLVDDHPTNRVVVARQLALAGYASEAVADGEQGLAHWRSGRFALLLTDVHMPGLDGYALAGRIRAEEAGGDRGRTPIVALTASALKGEAERCLAAGMDDYLAKPVGIADLSKTLHRWLPHTAPDDRQPAQVGGAGVDIHIGIPMSSSTLDVATLEALIGTDHAATRAVLDDFLASTADDLLALDTAFTTRDQSTVTRQAHRIKGAAGLIGATELTEVAARLEIAARTGTWTAIAPLRVDLRHAAERLHLCVDAAYPQSSCDDG